MARIQRWAPGFRKYFSVKIKRDYITRRACEDGLWKTVFYISGWLEGPSMVCNAVQWYLSNDFFYFAIFPFIALCYGRHKIAGIIACLACISVSIGHNIWATLDGHDYIAQTYKIYSAWPADRKPGIH